MADAAGDLYDRGTHAPTLERRGLLRHLRLSARRHGNLTAQRSGRAAGREHGSRRQLRLDPAWRRSPAPARARAGRRTEPGARPHVRWLDDRRRLGRHVGVGRYRLDPAPARLESRPPHERRLDVRSVAKSRAAVWRVLAGGAEPRARSRRTLGVDRRELGSGDHPEHPRPAGRRRDDVGRSMPLRLDVRRRHLADRRRSEPELHLERRAVAVRRQRLGADPEERHVARHPFDRRDGLRSRPTPRGVTWRLRLDRHRQRLRHDRHERLPPRHLGVERHGLESMARRACAGDRKRNAHPRVRRGHARPLPRRRATVPGGTDGHAAPCRRANLDAGAHTRRRGHRLHLGQPDRSR